MKRGNLETDTHTGNMNMKANVDMQMTTYKPGETPRTGSLSWPSEGIYPVHALI